MVGELEVERPAYHASPIKGASDKPGKVVWKQRVRVQEQQVIPACRTCANIERVGTTVPTGGNGQVEPTRQRRRIIAAATIADNDLDFRVTCSQTGVRGGSGQ